MPPEFQPYVGPRPFGRTATDQKRFFGRDAEASELLSRIVAHSTVLLYSQSGAGKTSLINAKLGPLLAKSGFEVLAPVSMRFAPPDDDLLSELSNIFVFNALRTWHEEPADARKIARLSLTDFLKPGAGAAGEDGTPRVVILDQFEEVFTAYQERSKDREEFIDQLGAALEHDKLLRVVFAMREDYIAGLDPYVSLLPEKLRSRFRLERLSEEDALLAVIKPLVGTEYSYAPDVAEELVEDLLMVPVETLRGEVMKIRGDSVEPVQLQVVCQTLWDKCQKSWRELKATDKKIVTREYLEAFGDVDQALSAYYESAILPVVDSGLVKEGVLRRWFEQSLITTAGTRGTVFQAKDDTAGIPNSVVDELENQHIIRAEIRGGRSRWYELTHDRFITPIKSSNESWLLRHSGGVQTPKRLEARTEKWAHDGRQGRDLIADEGELLEAERWLNSTAAADIGFSDTLLAFVQASRAARNEEQARIARRLKFYLRALVVMVMLLLGALLLIFVSLRAARVREQEAIIASRKADEQKAIADQRKSEAEKQKILADLRTKELEVANIIIQGKQTEAEQAAARAKVRERIATQNKAKAENYNQASARVDAEQAEAGVEYQQVLEVPDKDPTQECAALQRVQLRYEGVLTNSVNLGKDTRTAKFLINQIAKQRKDKGCP